MKKGLQNFLGAYIENKEPQTNADTKYENGTLEISDVYEIVKSATASLTLDVEKLNKSLIEKIIG